MNMSTGVIGEYVPQLVALELEDVTEDVWQMVQN